MSTNTKNLVLYHYDNCPFCRMVTHYLAERNINIPYKNTQTEPGVREELIKIGGKGQVPCLVIDGHALYESNDIIEWFEQNW